MSKLGTPSRVPAENQDVKSISTYLDQLAILNKKLSSKLTKDEQEDLKVEKQKKELLLIQILDKIRNQTDFSRQIQSLTAQVDVQESVEQLNSFLTKADIRITPKDKTRISEQYKELLKLVNYATQSHRADLDKQFSEELEKLRKAHEVEVKSIVEKAQLDADSCRSLTDKHEQRIELLEETIRKYKEEVGRNIEDSERDSISKARRLSLANEECQKLRDTISKYVDTEKTLRKEIVELNDRIRSAPGGNIRDLLDQLTFKEAHIQTLSDELTNQKRENDSKQGQVEARDREIEGCRFYIGDLIEQIGRQADEHRNLTSELDRLREVTADQLADMATADEIRTAVSAAFQTIIAEEDRKKIPIFTGKSTEESFPIWIKKAEKIATRHGWSDDDKLTIFSERLEGGAEDFAKNSMWQPQEAQTYAEWKKRMNAQYLTAIDKERLRHQLLTIKQKPNQPVREFISKLNYMFEQVYGEDFCKSANPLVKESRDDMKTRLLSSGLLPKYRNELWSRSDGASPSFEDLVKIANTVEQIVQRRELMEQSCLIAGIIEQKDESREVVEQQKKELESVKKDLLELKEKTAANVEAVNVIQQNRYPQPNRGRGRGRGGYDYAPRGRGQSYGNRDQGHSFQRNFEPQRQSNNVTFARSNQGYRDPRPSNFNRNQEQPAINPREQRQFPPGENRQPPRVFSQRGRGGGQTDRVCYTCNRKGHISRQCHFNSANQHRDNLPDRRIQE